jgi:GxxExxY protein
VFEFRIPGSKFGIPVRNSEFRISETQRQQSLAAVPHDPAQVIFREECVGDFYADIFVEEKVIMELRAVKAIAPEHQAQIINYLNTTEIEVGLLINFGNPRLEHKLDLLT